MAENTRVKHHVVNVMDVVKIKSQVDYQGFHQNLFLLIFLLTNFLAHFDSLIGFKIKFDKMITLRIFFNSLAFGARNKSHVSTGGLLGFFFLF